METPHEPMVLGPGEGRTFPFGRRTMITKVDAQDVAIFETMPEPGVPTALPHRHWEAVEAFYILDGEMEFLDTGSLLFLIELSRLALRKAGLNQ